MAFMAFVMVIMSCLMLIPFMLYALNLQASGWTAAHVALFGSMIASTDAASVSAVLRSGACVGGVGDGGVGGSAGVAAACRVGAGAAASRERSGQRGGRGGSGRPSSSGHGLRWQLPLAPPPHLNITPPLSAGGGPEILSVLLEGECLFNDASSLTLFEIFKEVRAGRGGRGGFERAGKPAQRGRRADGMR